MNSARCRCRETGRCKLEEWSSSSREDLLLVTQEIRVRPCHQMIRHVGLNLLKYKDIDILTAIRDVCDISLMLAMTKSFMYRQPTRDLNLVERFICSYDNILHPAKMLHIVMDHVLITSRHVELFVSAVLCRRGISEDGSDYLNILKKIVARGLCNVTCTNPTYQRCLSYGLGYECFMQIFDADVWGKCHLNIIRSSGTFNAAATNSFVRLCKNDIRPGDARCLIDSIGIEGILFNGIGNKISLSSVNWVHRAHHRMPFTRETMDSLCINDLATVATACSCYKYEDRRNMPRGFTLDGQCHIELDSDDSD
jgi:hypothetical protein